MADTATQPEILTRHEGVLADVTAAEPDALETAHGELTARIGELRPRVEDQSISPAELAELRSLAEGYRAVNGERTSRQQAREEGMAEASSLFEDIDAGQQATDSGSTTDGGSDATEGTTDGGSSDGGDAGSTGTPASAPSAAVAASGGSRTPAPGTLNGRSAAPAAGGSTSARIEPSIAITAAGDVPNFAAGTPLEFDRIGEALAGRMQSLRTVNKLQGNGELVPVVRMVASGVPQERQLKRGPYAGTNTARLDAAVSPHAITAAGGGLCAPLAIDYSYQTIGITGRPIRDALPAFQADRGGIQFRPDISPTTNTAANGPRSATDVWTNADDEAAAAAGVDAPRKGLWIVDCPDVDTAEVEAITLQIEYRNVSSRFDPETLQANQAAALIWHDRFAENRLLAKLQAASKLLTSGQVLGATRDLLVTLDRLQAYYRSVHRLGSNVALRAIMPSWVHHLVRADLARAMALSPTEALAISNDQIDGLLRTRGLDPVWHLDGADEDATVGTVPIEAQQYLLADPGDPVPNFPAQVDILLHTLGHFTFLDGGTLDLGIVRDTDTIERNAYRQFSETWEGVAPRGVEALRVVANVAPTGETAGTIGPISELTATAPAGA